MIGIDKGGIPGLAPLGMTLLIAHPHKGRIGHIIGMLVPVLTVADAGACYAYRDAVEWKLFRILLPPMVLGMILVTFHLLPHPGYFLLTIFYFRGGIFLVFSAILLLKL